MKKIMSSVAVISFVVAACLLVISANAYPMYIGEPAYYHVGRVDHLMAAVICWILSVSAAFASTQF